MCLRDSGGGQWGLSPSSQRFTSKRYALLVPEHAGERLALDQPVIARRAGRVDRMRRIRRLLAFAAATIVSTSASGSRPRDAFSDARKRMGSTKEPPGRNIQRVMKARLRARLVRIDAILALNQVAMECVFHEWFPARIAGAEDARAIRLVVGE